MKLDAAIGETLLPIREVVARHVQLGERHHLGPRGQGGVVAGELAVDDVMVPERIAVRILRDLYQMEQDAAALDMLEEYTIGWEARESLQVCSIS